MHTIILGMDGNDSHIELSQSVREKVVRVNIYIVSSEVFPSMV